MSKPLPVLFVWHFHQPLYLDYATGLYRMPWVRLHAIKDYYGFSLLLSRFPEVKATFNITPVLAEQLLDIQRRRASDQFMELSYRPADTLDSLERLFILRNFFALNRETMLEPFPRFRQMLGKRGRTFSDEELEGITGDFAVSEIRDIQVLFNLAWFHPILRAEEPILKELQRQGRDYTEEEKKALLDFQYEVISRVVPLWKRMADDGQIEISVSPYYHPILPLLLDGPEPFPEDARRQLEMAQVFCREVFGKEPAGCWPPEGAVSDRTLRLLAGKGFRWTAGDEGILNRTLGKTEFDRSKIYRPYRYQSGEGGILMLFRDQALSDKIGFVYRYREAKSAVADFCADLSNIEKTLGDASGEVSIILDGENAWEYYAESGVPFLSGLYAALREEKNLKTEIVSNFLSKSEPLPLSNVQAGSWINQDFHIWFGYPAADFAWKVLGQARQSQAFEEIKDRRAENSILAAEGSDWFWWFSPEHFSGRDQEFEEIFKVHLANFYRFLGREEPEELLRPIKSPRKSFHPPKNFITARIDGIVSSYYEWLGAGHFMAGVVSGAMHRHKEVIKAFFFGWDAENLYIRLDLNPENPEECCFFFNLRFGAAGVWSMEVKNGKIINESFPFPAAQGKVVELSFPWKALNRPPGAEIGLHFEVRRDGQNLSRYPAEGGLRIKTPGEDSEGSFWK